MSRVLKTIVLILPFCLLRPALADTFLVGTLSYDTFIPAGPVSAGTDAFNVSNLTGIFSAPPDFPVTDSLTFQSASLTLTLGDMSQQVIDLGDLGPGFLLDPSGNPVVQVPGDQAFLSAEFKATLSPGSFGLFDGTSFTADSTSIDAVLGPSSGSTLVADTDQTTIDVTGTMLGTPEPASIGFLLFVLLGVAAPLRKIAGVAPRLP